MCFRRKKNNAANKNFEDRELIARNSKLIDALLVLTDEENLKADLKKLQEELKFLIPSPNDKVYEYDKKIGNSIDDIRILLKKGDNAKASKMLRDVRELISMRNTLI